VYQKTSQPGKRNSFKFSRSNTTQTQKIIMQKHLNILALTAGLSLAAALSVQAQTIAYEGFNYPDGMVAGLSGGDSTGWGGAWTTGSAGFKIGTNVSSGLSYGGLAVDGGAMQVGTPQNSGGNGGVTTAQPTRILSNTLGNLCAANGGALWLSFLFYNPIYPTNPTGTSIYYRQSNIGFFSGASISAGGSEKADLGMANGSATVGTVWSAWGGTIAGATPNQSAVSAFSASVQFVLVKLVVDATTATDSYYAWINPSDSIFGDNGNTPSTGTATVSSVGAADLTSVNGFRFQAGNYNGSGTNAFYTVDEVRVGNSFADVTPVPEPVTFALAGLGGLMLLALRRRN
jgi:hypothetical protein